MTLIGLISDTHGLLRPRAAAALAGVCRIFARRRCGQAGGLERTFVDRSGHGRSRQRRWRPLDATPAVQDARRSIAGHAVHMLHNLDELATDPKSRKTSAVVVSGHTHSPLIESRGGVLYINPGSAGPRRFSLPISIGFLRLAENAAPEAWLQIIEA